jgi:hypothetical protein
MTGAKTSEYTSTFFRGRERPFAAAGPSNER